MIHGNSGRRSANRLSGERRAALVELASEKYKGVNRAHLADLLAEREAISVPQRTLRRVVAEASVPAVRRRRPRAAVTAAFASGSSGRHVVAGAAHRHPPDPRPKAP